MRVLPRGWTGLTSLVLAAFTACGEPTAPAGTPGASADALIFGGTRLVSCPSQELRVASQTIGPLGGDLSAGGMTLSIPPGAVPLPTLFTVTVPPSKYVEVEITALGVEHFVFDAPVRITLDYGRCTRSDIDQAPLTVWYIDGITDTPLRPMGGEDDKGARTVTFTTGHLSSYAIAY
jgi:hypothetical protein